MYQENTRKEGKKCLPDQDTNFPAWQVNYKPIQGMSLKPQNGEKSITYNCFQSLMKITTQKKEKKEVMVTTTRSQAH